MTLPLSQPLRKFHTNRNADARQRRRWLVLGRIASARSFSASCREPCDKITAKNPTSKTKAIFIFFSTISSGTLPYLKKCLATFFKRGASKSILCLECAHAFRISRRMVSCL